MSAIYDVERDIRNRIERSKDTNVKVPPITWVPEDVAYVASIYPLHAFEGGGQHNIPPMPKCENSIADMLKDPQKHPPALLKLMGTFTARDGLGPFEPKYDSAMDHAKDLVLRYGDLGVFIPPVPTDPASIRREDIQAAVTKLEVRYRNWIDINDDAWRRNGTLSREGVSIGYLAARHFGLDRDWAVRAGELGTCFACQKSVKAGIVKCPHCGSILDWMLAYRGGQATKEQAMEHGVIFDAPPTPTPKKGNKEVEL